ncbi:MAG: phosphopantetheine-binding protein [Nitrospirota bacterium]|nr:phosphopantetheine-binding protein [Nitrospirota bacterium]
MMVEQHITRIVSEELHVEEQQVLPDAHIFHDLAADSLDVVVLILA